MKLALPAGPYVSNWHCQQLLMSVCPYVSMSICQYVNMSVCQYVNMSVCQYVSMSIIDFFFKNSSYDLSKILLEITKS